LGAVSRLRFSFGAVPRWHISLGIAPLHIYLLSGFFF
jgi:hypothetical protein